MSGIFLSGERVSFRQLGGAGAQVILERWDLPSEPPSVDYEDEQRATVEHYPGNPVPTVQILGPLIGPVRCSGAFRDRLWFDLGRARRQRNAIEAICLDGYFVELAHGDRSYIALLKKTRFREKHPKEIWFELEFEIVQPAGMQAGKVAGGGDSIFPGILLGALEDLLSTLGGLILSPPIELESAAAQTLTDRYLPFSTAVSSSLLEGGLFVAAGAADAGLANRSASAFGQIRTSGNNLVTYLDGLTYEPASSNLGTGSIRLANYVKTVRRDVALTAEAARTAGKSLAAVSGIGWQAVYQARDGDTLQSVSAQFYGSPTSWAKIADANDLDNLALSAGQYLGIPN